MGIPELMEWMGLIVVASVLAWVIVYAGAWVSSHADIPEDINDERET